MSKMPEVWVLADDRPGNVNQALGVAEALGFPISLKKIKYLPKARLPNFLKTCGLSGVDKNASDPIKAPWPDIVIAAGRKTAPILRYIKRKSGGRTCAVQLMWPGFPACGFDLIATPAHDKKRERKNIMNTIGAAHRINEKTLKREGAMWAKSLEKNFPPPYIALLIGGNSGKKIFTPAHAEYMGEKASALAKRLGATLLVTASRRTSKEAEEALKKSLTAPHYIHDWRTGKMNPYIAYLALSSIILVSGDSISMCSEAAASGKPVYIFYCPEICHKKHKFLHQTLYEKGYARPFMPENLATARLDEKVDTPPLDVAQQIAGRIRELYGSP